MSSSFMAASPLSPANLLGQSATAAQAKTKAKANAAAATTSSTATDGLTSSTAGTTFLNLLVKELQNQDPTAPMDSTAMVGQMISLNQLDQLISINQTLGGVSSSTSANVSAVGQNSTSSAAVMAARASLLNSSAPSASDAAASAAGDPGSTLDFSKLNIPNGGK